MGRARGLRDAAQHRPGRARRRSWPGSSHLVAEHKHRIGFKGTLLIEPKPQEPTKHQYDYDVATVHGFLARHGLDGEYRVNIEANHATLAGHSFHHEVAYAVATRDASAASTPTAATPRTAGTPTSSRTRSRSWRWPLYEILRAGGFTTGGFNFDTKLRRQSMTRDDLFHAHIGGIDTLARALLVAADLIEDGELAALRDRRYAGWDAELGNGILGGSLTLADLEARVADGRIDPSPVRGSQERLENLINEAIWSAARSA